MTPGVEIDPLAAIYTHARGFAVHVRGPAGVSPSSTGGEDQTVGLVARKAAVATLVVVGIVALALALWKLRVLLSLFFLGLVIAAAIRPGIEWLHARRVPRSVGHDYRLMSVKGPNRRARALVLLPYCTQNCVGAAPASVGR